MGALERLVSRGDSSAASLSAVLPQEFYALQDSMAVPPRRPNRAIMYHLL